MNTGTHENYIREARCLFEKAEAESEHKERTRRLNLAISFVDEIMEDIQDPTCIQYLANLKLAYTRSFLNTIRKMNFTKIVCLYYYGFFAVPAKNEIKKLCQSDPTIQAEFNSFLDYIAPGISKHYWQ